jgi:hypothetical protein
MTPRTPLWSTQTVSKNKRPRQPGAVALNRTPSQTFPSISLLQPDKEPTRLLPPGIPWELLGTWPWLGNCSFTPLTTSTPAVAVTLSINNNRNETNMRAQITTSRKKLPQPRRIKRQLKMKRNFPQENFQVLKQYLLLLLSAVGVYSPHRLQSVKSLRCHINRASIMTRTMGSSSSSSNKF